MSETHEAAPEAEEPPIIELDAILEVLDENPLVAMPMAQSLMFTSALISVMKEVTSAGVDFIPIEAMHELMLTFGLITYVGEATPEECAANKCEDGGVIMAQSDPFVEAVVAVTNALGVTEEEAIQ